MTNIATSISEETYLKVMRLHQENPDLTKRELAEQLGVSVGGLNYYLNTNRQGLCEDGELLQEQEQVQVQVRLPAHPKDIAEKVALISRFLNHKMEEYEALKNEIDALTAEVSKQSFEEISESISHKPGRQTTS